MDYKIIFGLFLIGLISLSFSYDPCPKPTWKEPICDYWPMINKICADNWGLDPYFIASIVKKESDFNTFSTNQEEKLAYESGNPQWCGQYYGKGLMQLTGPGIAGVPYPAPKNWKYDMPPEASPTNAPYMADAYDPEQNLNRGCWFMKALSDHYSGDLQKMASAYRYGWQDVDQIDGLYVDPYNNSYVIKVMDHYKYYKSSAPIVSQPKPDSQEPSSAQEEITESSTSEAGEQIQTIEPKTKFCNVLGDYLTQHYNLFFKKLYAFLGKDYYQNYCENIYYPLVLKNPKRLTRIEAMIGLN